MRVRVLVPLLVFGLVAVCAMLVPACEMIATSRTQQLTLQRESAMGTIVQFARTALADRDARPLQGYLTRFGETYGEGVVVLDPAGRVFASVGRLGADTDVSALARAAARAVPQWSLPVVRPAGADTALVAESFTDRGTSTAGVVVLAVDLTRAKADITRWWVAIGAIGALLLLALLAASLTWTRWILRPVSALDLAANELAEHHEARTATLTGPPELRRLMTSFARMAHRVEDALEQQRGFVADASHQLRNPLAAIRLRVDALAQHDSDAAELAAVARDLDRLEHTVDRMLTLANAEHRAAVDAHAAPQADEPTARRECVVSAAMLAGPHRGALGRAGIRLVAADEPVVRLPCGRDDLDEMVEIALDNMCKYAGSGTTARVRLIGCPGRTILELADSGPGLSDRELTLIGTRFWRAPGTSSEPGTGLGVAIIRELARANHASVTIDRATQGGVRIRLSWAT